METINNKLYKLLDRKISSRHLEKILGASLYNGLIRYHEYSNTTIVDLTELLLKGLGSSVIFNAKFQIFLIDTILSDDQIKSISKKLQVDFTTAFLVREELLRKSRKKIGEALIELLV
jgi:hypothetical protein